MADVNELKAILTRIDVATDNIAADIRHLAEQIDTGLTEAEVADIKAGMEAAAVKLEATAAETPDVPPV